MKPDGVKKGDEGHEWLKADVLAPRALLARAALVLAVIAGKMQFYGISRRYFSHPVGSSSPSRMKYQ